jgi:hypothetical protein
VVSTQENKMPKVKKSVKKPTKKVAVKKSVRKPAKKSVKKVAKKPQPAPIQDVAVAPVVDVSGVVMITPVASDVLNK